MWSQTSERPRQKSKEPEPTTKSEVIGDKVVFFGDDLVPKPIDVLADDDVRKLERLQLINASARYELVTANQQLLDFHLNRVMQVKTKKQKNKTGGVNDTILEQLEESYDLKAQQSSARKDFKFEQQPREKPAESPLASKDVDVRI